MLVLIRSQYIPHIVCFKRQEAPSDCNTTGTSQTSLFPHRALAVGRYLALLHTRHRVGHGRLPMKSRPRAIFQCAFDPTGTSKQLSLPLRLSHVSMTLYFIQKYSSILSIEFLAILRECGPLLSSRTRSQFAGSLLPIPSSTTGDSWLTYSLIAVLPFGPLGTACFPGNSEAGSFPCSSHFAADFGLIPSDASVHSRPLLSSAEPVGLHSASIEKLALVARSASLWVLA